MKTDWINWSDRAVKREYSFGIKDAKGRDIGAVLALKKSEFVELPEGTASGYTHMDAGIYFSFIAHATRDGKPYGPIQNYNHFKTEEERVIAIDKYLANAKKRAAKKGGA